MVPDRFARRTRDSADCRRARRATQVLQLVERFVYDLGLLIAGRSCDIDDYVDSASRMREAVRPALSTGLVLQPEFGEYADVSVEGDILREDVCVRAVVEFDDRSAVVDVDGGTVSRARRRLRVLLLIDATLSRVVDHRIAVA